MTAKNYAYGRYRSVKCFSRKTSGREMAADHKDTQPVYAAFFALSALRSRLLLAASGPLSVSRAQSHQVKELE